MSSATLSRLVFLNSFWKMNMQIFYSGCMCWRKGMQCWNVATAKETSAWYISRGSTPNAAIPSDSNHLTYKLEIVWQGIAPSVISEGSVKPQEQNSLSVCLALLPTPFAARSSPQTANCKSFRDITSKPKQLRLTQSSVYIVKCPARYLSQIYFSPTKTTIAYFLL